MTDAPDARPVAESRRARLLREALVLLLAVAGIAIAARLALWQLDRAGQKLSLQAALDQRGQQPALPVSAIARDPAQLAVQLYRRARVDGHWVADRTVFLDNRQMDGKVGFFVVTPLRLDASGDAVLVQRGWVARNFDHRAALPSVPTPPGPVAVEGTIAAAPARLFEFAGAASGPIRQNVDVAGFARESGLQLLPLVIVESETSANRGDSLARHWAPPATDVQMHYGYVFQWSALGAGIAFLYVWFRIVRPRRRPR